MLLICSYKPLLLDVVASASGTGPWTALLIRAVFTLCLAATSLQLYAGLAKSIGIY